jgi:hypothetical protein
MPHKIRLIGQSYFNIAIYHHTLATQARVDARVNGPVNEVFFLVGYFLDIVHALVHINMAGAATAYTAAVVLQFNAVFQANIQYRFAFRYRQLDRFMPFLKVYFNFKNIHCRKSNKITEPLMSCFSHFDNPLTKQPVQLLQLRFALQLL